MTVAKLDIGSVAKTNERLSSTAYPLRFLVERVESPCFPTQNNVKQGDQTFLEDVWLCRLAEIHRYGKSNLLSRSCNWLHLHRVVVAMARPKKEVSQDDVEFVLSYIHRALNASGGGDVLLGKSTRHVALQELSGASNAGVLQQWVDKWMTDRARNKMWASLRQKRYKNHNEVKMVTLSSEAFQLLSGYAKRHKVTLSGAIERLFERPSDIMGE